MQQRSLKEKSSPGKWDISSAGHMISGENELDAIKRETYEEIGLKIDKVKTRNKMYDELFNYLTEL